MQTRVPINGSARGWERIGIGRERRLHHPSAQFGRHERLGR
jgi:hypothetical protein